MQKTKESSYTLFGSKSDPEVKESLRKLRATGAKVTLTPRPGHDTGIGPCGKHLCSCKDMCLAKL